MFLKRGFKSSMCWKVPLTVIQTSSAVFKRETEIAVDWEALGLLTLMVFFLFLSLNLFQKFVMLEACHFLHSERSHILEMDFVPIHLHYELNCYCKLNAWLLSQVMALNRCHKREQMYQTHVRECGHISSFYHIFKYVDVYFNLIAQSSPLMSVNKWRTVCSLLSFLYSLFCVSGIFKMGLDWFYHRVQDTWQNHLIKWWFLHRWM